LTVSVLLGIKNRFTIDIEQRSRSNGCARLE